MRALAGEDVLCGGRGADALYGGSHADRLYGEERRNRVCAGRGNDFVSTIGDGSRDLVDCGTGPDTANKMPGGTGPADAYRDCQRTVEWRVAFGNGGVLRRGSSRGVARPRASR